MTVPIQELDPAEITITDIDRAVLEARRLRNLALSDMMGRLRRWTGESPGHFGRRLRIANTDAGPSNLALFKEPSKH